jgi:hypothetical protein
MMKNRLSQYLFFDAMNPEWFQGEHDYEHEHGKEEEWLKR